MRLRGRNDQKDGLGGEHDLLEPQPAGIWQERRNDGAALSLTSPARFATIHPTKGDPRMTEIAPRITVDENIRFGKPVIQGTRVPVDLVVGKLAGGMTIEEVMEEYDLTREDVLAALAYAARVVADEQIRIVG